MNRSEVRITVLICMVCVGICGCNSAEEIGSAERLLANELGITEFKRADLSTKEIPFLITDEESAKEAFRLFLADYSAKKQAGRFKKIGVEILCDSGHILYYSIIEIGSETIVLLSTKGEPSVSGFTITITVNNT